MKRFLFFLVLSSICFSASAVGQITGILTQEMLDTSGEVLFIRGDCTLAGATVSVPSGKTLIFSGGTLDNGEIVGTGTSIQMLQTRPAFGLNLVISGTWNVPEVHDGWFAFDDSKEFVSNRIIQNILAFSNDETPCHIFFEENRTYYFELPYKGRADLGNTFSITKTNGTERRNYAEVYGEKYKDLRIFTIPSNTHLTVNNTLKMLPTNLGAYFIFWEYGKKDITVDGSGTIAADNDWHKYDTPYAGSGYYGEWGFIFRCFKCSNFTFRDITLADAFGDCLIYSGSYFKEETGPRYASGLLLDNVKILRARRNGVALGARDVVVRNCHFEGCGTKAVKGTKPRCGIDFEADGLNDYSEIGNQNVLMENCTFKDNYLDVASYNNNRLRYGKIATTVRNCTFTAPLKFTTTQWLKFENCYIPFLNDFSDGKSRMLNTTHVEFVNCEFGVIEQSVISSAKKDSNKFTDCKFNTAAAKK